MYFDKKINRIIFAIVLFLLFILPVFIVTFQLVGEAQQKGENILTYYHIGFVIILLFFLTKKSPGKLLKNKR